MNSVDYKMTDDQARGVNKQRRRIKETDSEDHMVLGAILTLKDDCDCAITAEDCNKSEFIMQIH